ncbi:MAG TPA: Rrf2 family transcriptional regulator [Tepidisphaeraceae bacterium]|jgi:Rrf2 family protein
MLCLSRKADYALIALGYLAERPDLIVSARDVASVYNLPQALLMNILKRLQKHRLVVSTRGKKGGYRIGRDLDAVSLHELIRILEGKVEPGCDHEHEADGPVSIRSGSAQAPIQALHFKLMQFLHDVSLADLVMPGRRIDVPAEMLRRAKRKTNPSHGGRDSDNGVVETAVALQI